MDTFANWLSPFLSSGSIIALPLVIIGGILTAFNPCCLPMYPAVFGYIGGNYCQCNPESVSSIKNTRNISMTTESFIFVLGMATATSIMGGLTASLGWVFGKIDSSYFLILVFIPMLMGLRLLGLLSLDFAVPRYIQSMIAYPKNLMQKHEILQHKLTTFFVGLLFSFVIAPCATPILFVILTIVAMQGDMTYGAILMFIYGLGSGLPLILIGHGFVRIQNKFNLLKYQLKIKRFSGILLILTSFYLVWNI